MSKPKDTTIRAPVDAGRGISPDELKKAIAAEKAEAKKEAKRLADERSEKPKKPKTTEE